VNTHTVFTIGHSTRSPEVFITLLRSNGVNYVVDVRTIPRSLHNPWFNLDTLPASLGEAGIGYRHMPGLGGLRRPRADSPNRGWRNASFRGFADYMQTPEFEENLTALMVLVQRETVALMCAEAVSWRCHRSLIADSLALRGIRVEHILNAYGTRPHRVIPWAKADGSKLLYPLSGGAG